MTPEELRVLANRLSAYGQLDREGIFVSVSRQAVHEAMEALRAYADMMEREARVKVSREAVRIEVATCKGGFISVDEATDRILSAIEGGE